MSFLRSPKAQLPLFAVGCFVFVAGTLLILPSIFATVYPGALALVDAASSTPPVLDKKAYDAKMLALAHIRLASTTLSTRILDATSTAELLVATTTATSSVAIAGKRWPTAAAYPNVGALLPFNRIVAYYGNFYSTGMGVLGEYPPAVMLQKLASTTEEWQAADPSTPVIPAIDYIAVTAQASAGKDGKYRARMPDDQIDKALALAHSIHGIVILDIQVGFSTVQSELPVYEKFLSMPEVHLAIDPEFSMKGTTRPGLEVGTMNETDINFAAQYLADLVRKNNLPPKILVVHRFTKAMLTGSQHMKPLPEVQIVEDMDGFGPQHQKLDTYNYIVALEPIQFTGLKLFYKNDIPPRGDRMMTPAQIIGLTPSPVFIQYQ